MFIPLQFYLPSMIAASYLSLCNKRESGLVSDGGNIQRLLVYIYIYIYLYTIAVTIVFTCCMHSLVIY